MAELWVESPERFQLCDFQETPVCLHVGSQSTPAGGVETDLLDVGDSLTAEDYAGQDVAGRIVLTHGNVRDVYEQAVRRRGAAGLVSDGMPWPAPAIGRTPAGQPGRGMIKSCAACSRGRFQRRCLACLASTRAWDRGPTFT